MSNPTKGMVAGKPIQTGTQTKEWDEGFERTFGGRSPIRGRFVYTQGGVPLEAPVNVSADWKQPDTGPSCKSEEEVYGSLTPSTDGERLDTRRRHSQYMKDNNLTIDRDFHGEWQRAEAARARMVVGDFDHKARRETIGRAAYEVEKKRRQGK